MTRFAGDYNGYTKKLSSRREEEKNYKTYLTVNAKEIINGKKFVNMSKADLKEMIKAGIEGNGSNSECVVTNTAVALQDKNPPSITWTITDETIHDKAGIENLMALKQSTGAKEVNFLVINTKDKKGFELESLKPSGGDNGLPKEYADLFGENENNNISNNKNPVIYSYLK